MLSNDKFIGFKVSFKIGRFHVKAYMEKDYYEAWKFDRDTSIKDVVVEEVEIPLSYFGAPQSDLEG
ncbi:hypothetical protein ACFPYJ_25630 [Paenibacillus solisilvae]|uniref:Uncharacterized protein n=1 Tax=Paenibacillus solisilvae TaxID=2486751 RepID=A0ABW0W7W1_9BACL